MRAKSGSVPDSVASSCGGVEIFGDSVANQLALPGSVLVENLSRQPRQVAAGVFDSAGSMEKQRRTVAREQLAGHSRPLSAAASPRGPEPGRPTAGAATFRGGVRAITALMRMS